MVPTIRTEVLALYGKTFGDLIDQVARICHDANRAFCLLTGDPALPPWDELDESYRESSRKGVRAALTPGNSPEAMHSSWMLERLGQGWQYDPVLDREAKLHPNLVPYDQLPEAQQRKDALFLGIVEAVLGPLL